MTFQNIQKRRIETFRIVAIYSLFGLAWIYGSDTVLGWLVHDSIVMVKIAVIKGSLFIICTATLLFFLINRFIRQLISAESAQLESLKNYETIFNTTNEAILVHDAQSGEILDVNDRMLEIYGYTREEALAFEIGDLSEGAPPYSQPEAAEKVRKALLEGPQVFEWHSRKKNGELFWSEVSLRRITIQESDRIIAVVRDISDRKQLDNTLRTREKRHQTILDSAMDGFWIVSHDGRLLEVNDAYCRMSGYSKQELMTMSIADFDVKETIVDAVAHNEKIMAQGTDRFEARHRRKDGTVYDVEVSATYISLERGILMGFLRDITDRKYAEASLKIERNRAQSYLDTVETIIIALDVEGDITLVNRKACQVLGYSEDQLLGQFWFKTCLPQPEGIEIVYPYFQRSIAGELQGSEYFENQVVTKTGELRHIAWHNATLRDEQGRIYSTLSAGEDITERRLAEKQLDERTRLLDTLLANLPVGVFMVEAPSGKPLIANNKALELLGRGILPDTNKENLTEVYEAYRYGTHDRYPVEDMPIVRGMYGESTTVEDLLVIRPDGTSKLLGISGTPVLNADNHPWASIVCFQDISDRKEYENEQLKMQKLESLGVLAGGIAHDFNNILTGIMGNISLAKKYIDDSHKSFKALEGAEKASVRAAELARQLLTFAKGGEPVKKVISIQGVVNESVSLVLHGSNVKSTVDIPDSIYPIEADEGQISQVFNNILINATQSMPGGGVVTVSARNRVLDANNSLALPPGPYVCISCIDAGCGIADADLNKVFDPYFTTKVSGSGLGLASARSIIIKHGGHIGVTSRVGTGTTFTIHLPSIGESAAQCQIESDAGISKDHIGGAILVMDDEEIIRELAVVMLEEIGYQVTTCGDGAEAIRLYTGAGESGTPFLAVIMDLTIPGGMGGKEAAKKILAIDPTACLIVSSGYSSDPIMSDYRSYGFTGAIAKPYRITELEQLLCASMP